MIWWEGLETLKHARGEKPARRVLSFSLLWDALICSPPFAPFIIWKPAGHQLQSCAQLSILVSRRGRFGEQRTEEETWWWGDRYPRQFWSCSGLSAHWEAGNMQAFWAVSYLFFATNSSKSHALKYMSPQQSRVWWIKSSMYLKMEVQWLIVGQESQTESDATFQMPFLTLTCKAAHLGVQSFLEDMKAYKITFAGSNQSARGRSHKSPGLVQTRNCHWTVDTTPLSRAFLQMYLMLCLQMTISASLWYGVWSYIKVICRRDMPSSSCWRKQAYSGAGSIEPWIPPLARPSKRF